MEDLLDHPEKAKRIADNSVTVFRERYLTQAAEACYWRYLLQRWKDVLGFEPMLYKGVEVRASETSQKGTRVKREQKRGVRYETFMYVTSPSPWQSRANTRLDYTNPVYNTHGPRAPSSSRGTYS